MQPSFETFRAREAAVDKKKIDELKDAVSGARLGVLGIADTLAALSNGQVDELFLAAAVNEIDQEPAEVSAILNACAPARRTKHRTPDVAALLLMNSSGERKAQAHG